MHGEGKTGIGTALSAWRVEAYQMGLQQLPDKTHDKAGTHDA